MSRAPSQGVTTRHVPRHVTCQGATSAPLHNPGGSVLVGEGEAMLAVRHNPAQEMVTKKEVIQVKNSLKLSILCQG